ncbi:aegerolysin type hemolysin [Aspergillus heterothallicus]
MAAGPESYSDWVDLRVTDDCSAQVAVQNAQVSWGKFYQYNNENNEISPEQVDKTLINPGQYADICACGRQGSASGTTGSIDLMDTSANEKICTLNWNCPYSGSNDLEVTNTNSNYTVSKPQYSPRGALGTVPISVSDS